MSRVERRAAVSHRRAVAALIASVAVSAVILVAWLPAGALLTQRRTLSTASATLGQLRAEDAALRHEAKNLSNPAEIARIARQQYQLIAPGEQAYQILPPPGKGGGDTDPYSGDPANSPLVSPSGAAELPPGVVAGHGSSPSATSTGTRGTTGFPSGLVTRVLDTLEFWR
jgi:cell division protein FtsB